MKVPRVIFGSVFFGLMAAVMKGKEGGTVSPVLLSAAEWFFGAVVVAAVTVELIAHWTGKKAG